MVFRSFAVIGAGNIGSFIVTELLRLKTIGTVSSVTVVSRSVSIPVPCAVASVDLDPHPLVSRLWKRLTLNGSYKGPSSPQ